MQNHLVSGTHTGSTEDILGRTGAVPAYASFPTVDELNAALEELRGTHPELIHRERRGTSRLGEPIWHYRIGSGTLSALIVGGVHPNEPIGSLTILHLVGQLASDDSFRRDLDTTWHIVPCADPDGMRLNEDWFADPSDRAAYARSFYRPAPAEQVEWTFPFSYKEAYFDEMMPETQALARMIDLVKPDLYVPLHNSESGGAYFYLSRAVPVLHDMLHRICAHLGVPLHAGEPESTHFTVLAQAIYEMGTLEATYDLVESLGADPYPRGSSGDASTSYARKYGSLSLIAELPQFFDEAADDTTRSGLRYRDELHRTGTLLVEAGEQITALLDDTAPYRALDTPYLRAAQVFAPLSIAEGNAIIARSESAEADRPATVAEVSALHGLVELHRLRWGGMLQRALAAEVAAASATAELRRFAAEGEARFEQWLSEALSRTGAKALPLADVVGVQYGAILAAHAAVVEERKCASR